MDTDDARTGDDGRDSRDDGDGPEGRHARGGAPVPPVPTGPGGLRVGDADRSAALDALGEHFTAGRLDVDEFGDRSARAAGAVYRADLEPLFTDLPAPHPPLPHPAAPPTPAPRPEPRAPAVRHGPSPAAAPAVGMGLALMLVMVLPVLALSAAVTGSVGGLLVLPLLFVILGHAGHARRRRWDGRWDGHNPGDHWGPGRP